MAFFEPMGISNNKLANAIGVPPGRIGEIVKGKRSISAETDLLLSKALGTSEGFWLNLQKDHDLEERKKALKTRLVKIACIYEPANESLEGTKVKI
jgi:addiction module HigA family antidote